MSPNRTLTESERAALERVAALPDAAIDTAAVPEVTDWSGAVRGMLYRPEGRRHPGVVSDRR